MKNLIKHICIGFVPLAMAIFLVDMFVVDGADKYTGGTFAVAYSEPWVDSMVPAAGFKVGGSAPTWGNFTDANIQTLQFAKGADNVVYGSVQLNHDYKESSDIRAHIHVSYPTAALATADTNVWELRYAWADISETFPTATTVIVTNSGAITQNEHRIISFGSIAGAGMKVSSILAVAIERTGTDAYDVYDDIISFLGFDVHYQVDALGSSAETSK